MGRITPLWNFRWKAISWLGRELRDRLIDKLSEGVRVFLLYDRIGSQGLPRRYLAPLTEAGAETAPFVSSRNSMRRLQVNFRNHRKILVVDGKTAFVGGHNVGNEYLGSHPKLRGRQQTTCRSRLLFRPSSALQLRLHRLGYAPFAAP